MKAELLKVSVKVSRCRYPSSCHVCLGKHILIYVGYYLVNVFHHDAFHLFDLSLHSGQLTHLLWVIRTVLQVVSMPRPVMPVPKHEKNTNANCVQIKVIGFYKEWALEKINIILI